MIEFLANLLLAIFELLSALGPYREISGGLAKRDNPLCSETTDGR